MPRHFLGSVFTEAGRTDITLRAAFTKTSPRSKLGRLLPLLHISPRIRSIKCTIQFKILKPETEDIVTLYDDKSY